MNSNDLREKFLQYFGGKGHKVLPSASLVPAETDLSVLFTTAGMQQFKRYYSNPEEAPSPRIATIQKCIRTGDIDEVGDETHGTFFEMLGNFSFGYPNPPAGEEGSYFKKEAIEWAWEFLTEVLKVEKNRIHATYFEEEKGVPTDQESLEILQSIEGLGKIMPQGFDDNFWSLGVENSPGGPTVEFYIDDVEVWNLVLNESVLRGGKYEPSQFQGVDTGMGLERLLAVLDNKSDIYQIDLFESIIKKIEEISVKKYNEYKKEFRIIADHIKATIFAINDGVLPSNKGAGYIVRRLSRRAIVKASQIGISNNFTAKIAEKVFETYSDIYFRNVISSGQSPVERSHEISPTSPEARGRNDKQEIILSELEREETKFRRTLKEGLKILESKEKVSGKDLFNLYQSFGIPSEISLEEIARLKTHLFPNAIAEYEELYKKHQELSRTASVGMFKGGLADASVQTTKLHTAAHLMLAALRQVLGDHVVQKGSNITAEKLRFDFSHPEKMTSEQIKKVEDIVNEKIKEDLPVLMAEMSVDEAKKQGAMGVFESKYGDKVKVYTIGPSTDSTGSLQAGSGSAFSREICGGPHTGRTGELGHFKIVKEESSSAGVRRIKAILE